jgi:ATP-binding protein involved in chromosome partitioning
MFAKVNVPILGLIENMAWFEGDDGKKYFIFGKEGGVREAEEMNVPLLGQIPIDIETRERGDSGAPIALVSPAVSKVSAAFHDVAAAVRSKLPTS